MANTKENIFPVGLNKTLQKKSNVAVYQVVAKPQNLVVCLLIICGAANVSVREEEVSSPFQSIIMPPTHTVDVLVSVYCVVVKVNTMLVMTSGCL